MCIYLINVQINFSYCRRLSFTKIAIIGDFNAAVGTTFEDELLELCTHHKLIIADYEK